MKKWGVVKCKFPLFGKFLCTSQNVPLTSAQKTELEDRLQEAENMLREFSEIKDEIDTLVSVSQCEGEIEDRKDFENQYHSSIANVKCLLKESTTVTYLKSSSNNFFLIFLACVKIT